MSFISKPFKYTYKNVTLYIVIANIIFYVILKLFPGFYIFIYKSDKFFLSIIAFHQNQENKRNLRKYTRN